jgi:hypothetical protein
VYCGFRQVPEPVDGDTRFPRARNGMSWSLIKEAFEILRDKCQAEFLLGYKNIPGAAMLLLATLPSDCTLEVSHREWFCPEDDTGDRKLPATKRDGWMNNL